MGKYKELLKECYYVIYPLGKGLPLCLYHVVKEKKYEDVKLRDLPVCKYKNYCPKEDDEKRRKQSGQTNNSD